MGLLQNMKTGVAHSQQLISQSSLEVTAAAHLDYEVVCAYAFIVFLILEFSQ